MEWGNDRCLRLVAAYERRPELWQSTDDNYRNKNRRQEAWKELADEVESTIDIVKAKMSSLLSSYRREKAKEKMPFSTPQTVTKPDRQERTYKSRWFAYSALKFLHKRKFSKNFPDGILGADNSTEFDVRPNKDDEIEYEIGEDGLTTLEGDASLGSNPNNDAEELRYYDKSPRRIVPSDLAPSNDYDQRQPKRFKSSHKQETLFDYESQSVPISNHSPDVCELYGTYLAAKLRSYSKQTQTVVQYLINNLLFKADMGYYDNQLEIEEPLRINQQNNVANSTIFRNGSPSPSSLGITLPKIERTERLD